jgi:thioredoxin-like negative regulator of GroEL
MAPIVDGLAEQYGDRLAVKRINAEQGNGPAIMDAYRIPGHPTILIFNREGQEVARLLGPQPAETVEDALTNILNTSEP